MAGPVLPEQPFLPPPSPPALPPPPYSTSISLSKPTTPTSAQPDSTKSLKIHLQTVPHPLSPLPFWTLSGLAFSTNPLQTRIFPPHLSVELLALQKGMWEYKSKNNLRELERRKFIRTVVLGDDGDTKTGEGVEGMIAGAIWNEPRTPKVGTDGATEKVVGEKEKEEEIKKFAESLFPAGANKQLSDKVNKIMDAKPEEFLGKDWKQEWWYLLSLATHPAYQRRGAASLLVKWGQEQAILSHKQNPKIKGCFLIATPAGLPLYRKLGFEVIGEIGIDMGEGGRNDGEGKKEVGGEGKDGEVNVSWGMVWKIPGEGR
ncbi:MAG: hypothetical protein MMC33_001439 [Icmadophila ericetorum]|nr:hypothetical protein [Icmadophila ericetorum]